MKKRLLQALAPFLKQHAERQVIVHAHMFKNAGTTLDWSLQRSFAEHHLDHRDDDRMREGASYLGPYLSDKPELQALSSHWITFPLPTLKGIHLHLLLMFRDPIERVRSVYNFERRQQPAETPGSRKAKQLCFKDYVKWQLEPMPGPVIKNFQTRYCSGDYLGEDMALLHEKARETVARFPLAGVVDRYDESMVLFEHTLKTDFPSLDLSYRVQNSSAPQPMNFSERRQQVLEELGDVADEVIAANRYDIELYAEVLTRFEQNFAAVPDRQSKLSDLHQRCESLS